MREILESEPEAAELRDAIRQGSELETHNQRVRLGELISNAIEQRRERDSAELLDELEEVVLAAQSEPREKEMMVLNAPLLVELDRIEELEAAVDELAEERGERMNFRLIGSMPAYHFIDTGEQAAA